MPVIRVKTGPHSGELFQIGDAPLVVGRDDQADIQVLDQGVSRRHSEIFRLGEMYFIRDLESRNGTFVNEERISEELLRDGDEIRIGSTIFGFEDAPPGGRRVAQAGRVRTSPNSDATTTIQLDLLVRDLEEPPAEPRHREESRDLRVLYRVAKVISDARDPRALLEQVVRLAVESVKADHACIFVRREGAKDFELEASHSAAGDAGGPPPLVSTRIIQEVVRTSRAVLEEPEESASSYGSSRAAAPAAVICAPLVAMDQIHGVLYCSAERDSSRFDSEALEIVTAVAIQGGIALQSLIAAQKQERAFVSAVKTLAAAIEMRDPIYTGHSARVATVSGAIAQALGLPRSESRRIQLAALLHNVGTIALPPQSPSEEDSRSYILKRNDFTEKLIKKMEGLEFLLPVVRHYHERFDGAGFPDGLRGDKIPLASRILAVADRLDVLTVRGDPPAYEKLALKDALMKLRGETGARFDPRVVDALIIAHRGGYLLAPEELLA